MRFPLSCAWVLALALFALGGLTPSALLAQPKLPNLPPDLMAPTDPLSPADERKQFTVPEGFDVQLVASEPDIQKPMQMAFDAKGRLWVTTSYHYPFAVAEKSTDKLFVLSDFDPATGKARKVQKFAEDLNIPIGILPLPDCQSCIVSSVGEIRKYTDADGDGKADKMEVLFKGFGSRDTHGMYNSYTYMPDGWVYACHGFANDSTVRGKDGHEVKMQSGHTFRFKPDGSRIEVWTRGQVNPFGMTVDPWFNLYTADCHSKPITQLIPGAYYQSFGKPHDGLDYAPHVTSHAHGSTGLCGLAWYDADQFPAEYPGTMFVGNVVTNRINFDRIEWKGASPVAKELPDFLVSKDRWFRPVDIKLGPDGALYVADFYNKIIGHYEVDLKDPRRDKDRGRIWRIMWKGKDGKAPVAKFAYSDLTKQPIPDLYDLSGHDNLMVRLQANLQIQRRSKEFREAVEKKDFKRNGWPNTAYGWAHDVWNGDNEVDANGLADMLKGFLEEKDPKGHYVPVHMLKVAATVKDWSGPNANEPSPLRVQVARALEHKGPHIQRAATEAVIAHPHADFVKPLIEVLKKCDPADAHLRMAARIALRNCLRNLEKWPESDDVIFVEMAIAIPDPKTAEYLVGRLDKDKVPADRLPAVAEHVARYGSAKNEEFLFGYLSKDHQKLDAILAGFRGVQARGEKLRETTTKDLFERGWGALSSGDLFTSIPQPNDAHLKPFLWGTRLLTALPAVANYGPKAENPKKGSGTVEFLGKVLESDKLSADHRVGAAEVLLLYVPQEARKVIEQIKKESTPDALRERFLVALASSGDANAKRDARDLLKNVPYRTAVPVSLALASTLEGAEVLLDAVRAGIAPARILQEKAILERLRGSNAPDWQKRVNDLTKNLPPADQRIAALLKTRADGFAKAKPDKELGAKLFTKHCAACHKIGDMGGKIAPQLDGVGVRGVERLLEDILDPNRNVDAAFRARAITLKTEKTLTALMLRVEGEVLVVADLEGKEQRIPLKDIETNRETLLSAMPANFSDVIPEADLHHIIAYLLDQKAKK